MPAHKLAALHSHVSALIGAGGRDAFGEFQWCRQRDIPGGIHMEVYLSNYLCKQLMMGQEPNTLLLSFSSLLSLFLWCSKSRGESGRLLVLN